MIIDAFPFFNELDILEIRLNELNSIVDFFMLVESKKTFSNKDKPLYFLENSHRFENFKHKILHVILQSLPTGDDPWVREVAQRKFAIGFFDKFPSNSICMLSDADEVPSVDSIKRAQSILKKEELVVVKHFFCHGYLNKILTSKSNGDWAYWGGTRIAKKSFWDHTRAGREHLNAVQINGGWHFRNTGTPSELSLKLKSYSHHRDKSLVGVPWEQVTEGYISNRVSKGEELCEEGFKAITLREEFLPKYVRENKEKFKRFLA
jgi:hypothetical protein